MITIFSSEFGSRFLSNAVVLDPSYRTHASGRRRSQPVLSLFVQFALEGGKGVGRRWRVKFLLVCKNCLQVRSLALLILHSIEFNDVACYTFSFVVGVFNVPSIRHTEGVFVLLRRRLRRFLHLESLGGICVARSRTFFYWVY